MTAVINNIKSLNIFMNMLRFRLTEEKVNEHLGTEMLFFLNPLRERNYRMASLGAISFAFNLIIVAIIFSNYILLGITLWFGAGILPAIYLIRSDINLHLAAGKIKELVNDPNLLWLNKKQPEERITKFGRSDLGSLSPTTFKILSYLKKEETARGMHRKIKSMKDSNSAYQTLKRLADKKVFSESIVKREDNDFKYVPWEFVVVDKKNLKVKIKKARRIEKILSKIWEQVLKQELN